MRALVYLSIVTVFASIAFGQAITDFASGAEYDSYYGDPAGDVVGWKFTVAADVSVTDLGIWNADKTGGIESPHEVAIWDASQALISSVIVEGTGSVVGDWVYASITPVVLAVGQTYTIGAIYVKGDDDWYISGAMEVTTDPGVTWLNAVYPLEGDLGFVYPENNSDPSSGGRFGPNFLFGETSLARTTWGAIKTSM